MSKKERILIICHGHPELGKGGGEIAAYNLFQEIRQHDDYEVVLLAYAFDAGHFGTPFSVHKSDGSEVLFSGGHFDSFLLSQTETRLVWDHFRIFLESYQPTIVHFQHYLFLGLEFIREVRKYSSKVPIILTLHEYLAICFNSGQMIKTHSNKLCYKASPHDCYQCFPKKSPEDFQLREMYIKSFFSLVDVFICPSHFLLERYVEWGIPRDKIIYLENGQPFIPSVPHRKTLFGEKRNRFGYFGTLSYFKGVLILLEAVTKLSPSIRQNIVIDIYGSNLKRQGPSFENQFYETLKPVRDCVRFFGPYEKEEMPKLIENIDWVVMPSIWWENAPLVIKEAFIHKRPVICSNIGGMAEKVEDEKSGLHFRVGDSIDLAKCIERAATDNELWEKLVAGIPPSEKISEVARQMLKIYEDTKKNK
jgi:glycosyltransferase involved in cell wall biosynthesis